MITLRCENTTFNVEMQNIWQGTLMEDPCTKSNKTVKRTEKF